MLPSATSAAIACEVAGGGGEGGGGGGEGGGGGGDGGGGGGKGGGGGTAGGGDSGGGKGGGEGGGDVSEIVAETLLYVILPAMPICPACRLMTSPTTLTTADPAALVVSAMLLSPMAL